MKKVSAFLLFMLFALIPAPSALAVSAASFNGLPNSKLTPGIANPLVTQATIGSTICVIGYTKTIRPPASYTTALKIEQLKSGYNVGGDLSTKDYEEDHLIPLEVGGNPSAVGNLWPEPRFGNVAAGLKDRLENKMHLLVCSGKLSLVVAQSVFKVNWLAGYKKYVGTLPTGAKVPVLASPSAASTPPPLSTASPTPIASPSVSTIPKSMGADGTLPLVHAGSFCSPAGAVGQNASGTVYTCKPSATDSRNRLRQ